MKKKNWYRALSLADDQYIAEAHPENTVKPKRSRLLISLVAACACFACFTCFVVTSFNLWLFIPFDTTPPDVSQYADSEYYGVIQKLNTLTYQPPRYKNNAQRILAAMRNFSLNFGAKMEAGADGAMPDPTSPPESGANGAYREITDNQVSGIVEADRIKRSDTHIYYLDVDVLRVFLIDKESTREVGSYEIGESGKNYLLDQVEFYLSSDCKTATVITQYYTKTTESSGRFVNLISLDVSDPENIVKRGEFSISGAYMSSRKIGGSILLLTEFAINKQSLDFDDETTFLPQIDEGDGLHSIPASAIISPEKLNSTRYTVVMKLSEDTLRLSGTAAFLSYSEDVYVSHDNVFLTRVFADKKENDNGTITTSSMTEITCLAYGGEEFEVKGSTTVKGYVKDQWSMDEKDGILRVVTTTNESVTHEQNYSGIVYEPSLNTAFGESSASLYCIDLSTFEIAASVMNFAPPYEEVQSVRFDGDAAYVCTSIERSDPVFFFDLSDLDNITYKDTGTIEGFSTSLINLGNGYLLGIGTGDGWRSFKVEVYEETEDGVRSVCKYEIAEAEYSEEYKSYYVDRENQLIGIGIINWSDKHSDGETRYILLHFDGYELRELVDVPLSGKPAVKRGVYIDGYMYMFGYYDFKVEKVFD